jgi:DNA-binding transcriptional MerR regulator
MSAVAFDTLKFAKRLKEAGFTESQAEALASAQVDLIEANLATKSDMFGLKGDIKEVEASLTRDIKEVEAKLTRDIESLRAEVKHDLRELDHGLRIAMAEAKASTIKWVAGLLLAQAALVATLVKLL